MTMDYKKYFTKNAADWIRDAYLTDGYSYPVGAHRLRLVMRILQDSKFPETARLLDVGSGGGNWCCEAAKKGYTIDGVDRSAVMIRHAGEQAARLPSAVARRIKFYQKEFDELRSISPAAYDFVTALGLIGYLPDERVFLSELKRLVKPGGLIVFSCRNRLFNMFPGSKGMRREIEQGTALQLLDEIDSLYDQTRSMDARKFLSAVRMASECATTGMKFKKMDMGGKDPGSQVDPRQQTPAQIATLARKARLKVEGFYGVHPHLMSPRLRRSLPRGVFNALSDALCVFESSPLSLVWSSVFLAVLRLPKKQGRKE